MCWALCSELRIRGKVLTCQEETAALTHTTKPCDASAILEMHARGFGTSWTNPTREGKGQAGKALESKEEGQGLHWCDHHWGCPLQSSGLSHQGKNCLVDLLVV